MFRKFVYNKSEVVNQPTFVNVYFYLTLQIFSQKVADGKVLNKKLTKISLFLKLSGVTTFAQNLILKNHATKQGKPFLKRAISQTFLATERGVKACSTKQPMKKLALCSCVATKV